MITRHEIDERLAAGEAGWQICSWCFGGCAATADNCQCAEPCGKGCCAAKGAWVPCYCGGGGYLHHNAGFTMCPRNQEKSNDR